MPKLYFIKTRNKAKFLKSEHSDWVYWEDFSYAEYLREMTPDAINCPICKVYYWEGCKKRCSCNPLSLPLT